MNADVVVIDYGVGNLLSVSRGFEHCGASVLVSNDPEIILAAPRIVLPGVGAFRDAMAELHRRNLDEVVRSFARLGKPLLGICLGMQLLLDESEEFGVTSGLGLIPGRVIPIPTSTSDGHPQKVPHIGWSELSLPDGRSSWDDTLLQGMAASEAFYFVHSFMAAPQDPSHRVADCQYGGAAVSAVIARANIHGCQFHPEKSGTAGLKVLKHFLSL
ncbi:MULTISPECIES: imidazole glycerol phosphate synthase subunit HisH [unclassified Polaromonas]|uniref:imidazole glycerol phosphate synthase subunit HisH n=1 Tax=unclassified Polaromonas TaxID=2638319 RepID=UPI000F079DAC|nr:MULTISPECIES: imidazole glycerol phosphate synthase subunit HisH [unclassified Polaromonas]AYQ27182.1 imidazole glycerol phosphate synthase subunit HisH [Polaromonas sp. SP1]QGJ17974.1 imidazole glycerol phosphate synthase subunit HisH [Polaromonas sp. Pch-P]